MRRTIVGFHRDEAGDWVAELSCLHGQHVRHRPPFQERPWVTTEAGRAGRVGTELDGALCDRAELPQGLVLARTAGPFDETTLPAGLRRSHRVAEGTWGRLRVLEGSAGFALETAPPVERRLSAGDAQPIPPGVAWSEGGCGMHWNAIRPIPERIPKGRRTPRHHAPRPASRTRAAKAVI